MNDITIPNPPHPIPGERGFAEYRNFLNPESELTTPTDTPSRWWYWLVFLLAGGIVGWWMACKTIAATVEILG